MALASLRQFDPNFSEIVFTDAFVDAWTPSERPFMVATVTFADDTFNGTQNYLDAAPTGITTTRQAFQTYVSSDVWANEKGKATPNGGFVSANTGLDVANVASAIDQLSVEILQDPESVFRFDGSDLMPGAVGAGSFWKEITAWITGKSTKETLSAIEGSWPAS